MVSTRFDYNNNTWKISSKVKDEIRNSIKTTVDYIVTFDCIENVVKLQIHNSVNREYN
jgi:hypothetical protein